MWSSLPDPKKEIFLTLAKHVRTQPIYKAPVSVHLFPQCDVTYWRAHHLNLYPRISTTTPIEHLDNFLESEAIFNPAIETILHRLETLDSKRFNTQIIERKLNAIGLRVDVNKGIWIIKPRERNVNDFKAGQFYFDEIDKNIKQMSSSITLPSIPIYRLTNLDSLPI